MQLCNYNTYNLYTNQPNQTNPTQYNNMNFFAMTSLYNGNIPDISFSFTPTRHHRVAPVADHLDHPDNGEYNGRDDCDGEPENRCIVSNSIYHYLCESKKTIETCDVDDWDTMKKYTNPYEFIHTIVPGHKCAISKLKPLSRSFYKMIEIIKHCKLLPYCTTTAIQTFHLAEGPGGFIEALVHIRSNQDDVYHGMTLVDDRCFSCPGWKKSRAFLDRNPNVRLEYGADGTGDLLNISNYDACCTKYLQQMQFISADGGFDFSSNFNNQETLAQNLIVAEVLYAISMQKPGGTFVLKIFDIFTKVTVDLLHLLCCVYDDVIIFKPNTSRIANSEKYVVCKQFNVRDMEIHAELISKFRHFFITVGKPSPASSSAIDLAGSAVSSVLSTEQHNLHLLTRIEEINAILGQQQIENIATTVSLIQSRTYDRLEAYKRANIQKCITWCDRYDIACNKTTVSTNTFIPFISN